MRILVVHNAYRLRGGEDAVVDSEIDLLRSRGNEVEALIRHNDEVNERAPLALAWQTLWSRESAAWVRDAIERFRPDVMHVHNTLPLVSPSIYWAAAQCRVPVVQTLHNFRLLCPQAMLLREGKVCEDCVGRLPLAGIRHACYRDSRAQTAVVAGMVVLHRGLGTFRHKVGRFIALTDFCRDKFIEGGLPAERVVVKPNFVDVPVQPRQPRQGLLFVGRLSQEKGVHGLAAAAASSPDVELSIAGDGPDAAVFDAAPHVRRLGRVPADDVLKHMGRAVALVLPSICYENFPRTIVEAFACGTPVIASRLGAMGELVEHGRTGLLVNPADAAAWSDAMRWAQDHPAEMAAMGDNARQVYEARFGPEENHGQLIRIYRDARDALAR